MKLNTQSNENQRFVMYWGSKQCNPISWINNGSFLGQSNLRCQATALKSDLIVRNKNPLGNLAVNSQLH